MSKVHLRPIPKSRKLRGNRYGVFDIETWGLEPKRFALGAVVWFDGEYHDRTFTDPNEMKQFIFSRRFKNYTFFGHNVEYDLLGILDNPLTFFDKIIYNKSRFILGIKKISNKDNIKILDSMNLFQCKLEDLGSALGYEKGKTPEKFVKGIKSKLVTSDFEYCLKDCYILIKSIYKLKSWVFDNFQTNIGATIASTALKIWQTNWSMDLYVDDYVNNAFRLSYYGGRTEVFIKGTSNKHLNYYDINSLYPFVYSSIRLPDPSRMRKGRGKELFNKIIKNKKYEGCANVILYNNLDIPILPMKDNGKLMFYRGYVQGYYNFNELRFSLDRGYEIVEVNDFYYSYGIHSPFQEYASIIYSKRKRYKNDHNKMGNIFCKFLLNSLYGKFGEIRNDAEWGQWCEPKEGKVFEELRDGWGYWKHPQQKEIMTDHTIFAWCSYITSGARIRLYEFIERCNEVWYCDTDSIITPDTLETGEELGEMKLEGVVVKGIFLKPKTYHVIFSDGSENKRMKGIPKRAVPESITQTSIEFDRFFKSKESFRRGKIAGTKNTVKKCNNFMVDDKRCFNDVDILSPNLSKPFERNEMGIVI